MRKIISSRLAGAATVALLSIAALGVSATTSHAGFGMQGGPQAKSGPANPPGDQGKNLQEKNLQQKNLNQKNLNQKQGKGGG